MSNFWKQKVAQESASGMQVEETSELIHEGSAFAVENGEVEQLEKDGEVLADDMEQLDAIGKYVDDVSELSKDSFDAIDVAQESIRKRWGVSSSKVAQESLGGISDLRLVAQEANKEGKKTLWSRFIAWLKEMAAKLKERWIKFHNAGKTLSKRAKAYKETIKGLGKKKDDKVSGGWISQLTVNNKFIGNDGSAIKDQINYAKKSQKAQANILETVRKEILDAFNLDDDKIFSIYNNGVAANRLVESMKKSLESKDIIGNKYVAALGEGESFTYELHDRDGGVQDEIDTPALNLLEQVVGALDNFGKELEGQLLEFRKTNELRNKVASLESKLDKATNGISGGLSKGKSDEFTDNLGKIIQSLTTLTISRTNTISQAESFIWKNLGTGLDSYIKASIKAYDKK